MRRAAELARRGRGSTAPNPCVGAVLARGAQVLAEGWHKAYGGPHAEIECLADAKAKGIDCAAPENADLALYVTLEPCNHTGKTPPCSKAILEAGVRNVFVGAMDPNPIASGGAQLLRDNGVQVKTGICQQQCQDLIADFMIWNDTTRPYNILKLAMTLDGKIATRTGHSQWISGPQSRARVHALRACCGAVIVGGDTFREDDPQLTVRIDGTNGVQSPLAVVVTSHLPEADADFHLLRQRPVETIFWTTQAHATSATARALQELGCRVWGLPQAEDADGLDLASGLERLRQECGVWYTLCEGGGTLGLSFLAHGLMDEFLLFMAPKVLGDSKARSLFSGLSPETMDEALGLRATASERTGDDFLLTFRPKD